jgi:17beta-estradiol 17-dehydrogenase / very-long-chain 3-oxoacyl-CoA reductase
MAVLIEDPWKEPVTALFAGIGLLYISLKIFSFWRLIASLFILPGTSVSVSVTFNKA